MVKEMDPMMSATVQTSREGIVRHATTAVALIAIVFSCGCRQGDTSKNTPSKTTPPTPPVTAGGTSPKVSPNRPFIPSANNLLRVRHMVLSVTMFTLLHELGHMIVNDYDPAVLGEEEDGADKFATLLMTPAPRPAGSPPDSFDPAVDPDSPGVMWAAWWWHEAWTRQAAQGIEPDYGDRHGLDEQRSRRVMCLVYGSDPDRFEKPFRNFLVSERRAECVEDAANNRRSWARVLDRPLGGGWWKYEGPVSYYEAPPALSAARTFLMERRVLERFAADFVNQLFVPDRAIPRGDYPVLGRSDPYRLPIALVGDACLKPGGRAEANAWWDPGARRITLCYALVHRFEQYSRETIARTAIGQGETWPSPPQ